MLAPGDPDGVATGFLVAGPWDSVTKKINKDENLRKTIRQDELDDTVTTTFATFQGLTVNCARCHDHKFDPIPTRDYYRLTAVFNGAGFGERETATPEQRAAREAAASPVTKEFNAVGRKLAGIEDPVRTRLLEAKYQAFDRVRAGEPRRIPLNPIWNRSQFPAVTAKRFRMAIVSHGGKRPRIGQLELLPAGHAITAWEGAGEATPDSPAYLRIDFEDARSVSEIRWSSDRVTGSREGSPRVYRFESSTDGEDWTTLCSSLDHEVTNELALPEVSEAELAAALPPGAIAQRNEWIRTRDEIQARMDAQRYLLHDRDTKFCAAFLEVLRAGGISPLALPPRSPNLNSFAERWVGAIKKECLSKLILFGEASLRRALTEFFEHYHCERNHQARAIFSSSLRQTDR